MEQKKIALALDKQNKFVLSTFAMYENEFVKSEGVGVLPTFYSFGKDYKTENLRHVKINSDKGFVYLANVAIETIKNLGGSTKLSFNNYFDDDTSYLDEINTFRHIEPSISNAQSLEDALATYQNEFDLDMLEQVSIRFSLNGKHGMLTVSRYYLLVMAPDDEIVKKILNDLEPERMDVISY